MAAGGTQKRAHTRPAYGPNGRSARGILVLGLLRGYANGLIGPSPAICVFALELVKGFSRSR